MRLHAALVLLVPRIIKLVPTEIRARTTIETNANFVKRENKGTKKNVHKLLIRPHRPPSLFQELLSCRFFWPQVTVCLAWL